MEAGNKSSNLFESLIQHLNDPFLVLDVNGKILSFNDEASELLGLNDRNGDIFSSLDDASSDELKLIFSQKLPIKQPISIGMKFILQSGDELDATLIVNSYKEKDNEFIFCRIKKDKNKIVVGGKTEVVVKTEDFKEIIHNTEILNILEEVKSLYPFTYIGKEKVQKAINNLDELFWIQNKEGNYQILNDKLANNLGVSISQVEGKPVNSFLPSYMVDFQNSLVSYLQKSLNCLIIEGMPLNVFHVGKNYQTIEIPLSDVDNNVLAIIGVTQTVPLSIQEAEISDIFKSANNLLQFFPKPIALIDKSGIFKQATEEFRKLFESEFHDLRRLNYSKVLPQDAVGIIEQFILSSADSKKYELNNQKKFKKEYSGDISLELNKIYNDKYELEGISILIENLEEHFDFGKLFVRKGKMYELLIDNNPEPIFIYDTENLRFLDVNKAALDLYGYTKDEFLHMDLTDLYTTEDIQTLLDTSKNELDEDKFYGPYRHIKKDGSTVFVELSRRLFRHNDNDAQFNIIRDVTEKLELEKKNKSFDAIFNNNDNLIFVTDTSGFISFVNETARKLLGHSKADFKDSSFASYLVDEDRKNVNTSVFGEQLKDVVTLNINMKSSDGGAFEAELTAVPILNYKNEPESFTIIVKKKEEKIVETKEVIKEVIVEKPVVSAPITTTTTESSEKVEPSFLASLFHEILTPINVILGFVQDLTDSISNLTPEQKESAEIINQNRERLLNTMNSVIEYSNIEKNSVDFDISSVAITEVIEDLQDNMKEIIGAKEVEFAYGKISSSLTFKTDKAKFQNLINLLVKFAAGVTKEKKIYFSAYSENENRFIVFIKDNYDFATKNLFEFYKNAFLNDKFDPKEFGISRLSVKLAKAMFRILNGKVQILKRDNNEDLFFVFPVEFEKIKEVEEKEVKEPEPAEEESYEDKIEQAKEESHEDKIEQVKEESHEGKIEQAIEELKDESILEETEVKQDLNTIEKELEKLETEQEIAGETDLETGQEQEAVNETELETEPEQERESETELEAEQELASDFDVTVDEVKNEEETDVPALSDISNEIDLSKLRCLYVEDQVDSQILFKVQMKELKEIKFAVSFEEALPMLDSDSFDFIVLDINLQGEYNGLDALKLIKKMPNYENVPIIAVTAYVLPGDKEKFIATGFNEFISKPIFKEKMVDSLARIFLEKM